MDRILGIGVILHDPQAIRLRRGQQRKIAAPAAKKAVAAPSKKTTTAKKMTKAEWVRFAAEKLELTTKQSAAFTELLASTAVQETKKTGEFAISGLVKLVKATRTAILRPGVDQGQSKDHGKVPRGESVKDVIEPVK